jgi:hypothetical protein
MAANQSSNVNLPAQQKANILLIIFNLNLVLCNSITPTLYDYYQQCPHPGNFTVFLPTHIRRYQKLEQE